jgi:hypothetical protein
MDLQLDDLTINIAHVDMDDLCECWMWLIPDLKQVLMISKMGDMFIMQKDGCIYWLATDMGNLTKIANDYKEFEQLLLEEDNLDNWFLPLLIQQLIAAGMLLGPNQVYSFKLMPVMGGDYAVDNIEPTDLSVHFTITGQICQQIKNLPDGTKVKIKIVD